MINVNLGNEGALSGYTVLVCSRELQRRSQISRALESSGYIVQMIDSDHQQLEAVLANATAPAVALVELRDNDVTGFELMSKLRTASPESQIVTLALKESAFEAIEAERRGAFWHLVEPVSIDTLLFVVARACIVYELTQTNKLLLNSVSIAPRPAHIVGLALSTKDQEQLKRLAEVKSTVLITGETGTGKTTLARFLHQSGPRAAKPIICISCGAIPRDLLESELFGYERGAFTGANSSRAGSVELANGGTLFLDEIGELPLDLQPKLLSFLQDKEVRRLGSTKTIPIDVRVIAATNADLEQLVSEKRFRQDLFYRLNVAGYTIPPLRDRAEIIPRLAENFLKGLAERLGERRRTLTPGSIAALKRYSWPGNIRELENVLEKAAIFSPKSYISEVDLNLPEGNNKLAINPCNQAGALPLARQNLKELEREAIRQTLESVNGDKYQAAKFLGISVKSVYNKVKSLKLN